MTNNVSTNENGVKVHGGRVDKVEIITNVFLNTDTADIPEVTNWKERLIAVLQKVPSKADNLKPLIQFLVTTIAPTKIYMLEHNDFTDAASAEYIDLLIVVSGRGVSFNEMEPMLEWPYLKDRQVCCSLHSESYVLEGLKNGSIFYSLNCIPENIVYDDNAKSYPVLSSEQLEPMLQVARETFMKGFEKAKCFYECAVKLFSSGNYEPTLFMLHQATELTCRSLVLSLNGYDLKTHKIRTFRKHLRRCASRLLTIFRDDTEEEKNLLDILEKGYVDARYEDDFKVEEGVFPLLFERVKLFQDTAYEVVKQQTTLHNSD
jgi:HEPN domain-containing protein